MRQSVDRGLDEKNLPDNPLLDDVFRRLFAEQVVYLDVMEKEGSIKSLHAVQDKLIQALQKVGASGELETILRGEQLILKNEREHYASKHLMKASLDSALLEMEVTLELVNTVQSPEAYRSIADGHKLPKNRIGNLPKDEARQFFKSHRSRLENSEKYRTMGLEEELTEVRKTTLTRRVANISDCRKTH